MMRSKQWNDLTKLVLMGMVSACGMDDGVSEGQAVEGARQASNLTQSGREEAATPSLSDPAFVAEAFGFCSPNTIGCNGSEQ